MRDFSDTIPYRTPAQKRAHDAAFEELIAHLLPQPQPPDVEPPEELPEERDDASMEALAWWLVAAAVVALLAGVVVWVTA
jgi:type VI protein secretion system component VasF